jgi:hypothetical protein
MPSVTMRRRKVLVLALASFAAAGVTLAASARHVWAQQPPPPKPPPAAALVVNAEVMVLYATTVPGPGSIDPAIGKMPQLTKPPFSVFNTYRLLDKKVISLELGKSGPYTLPNGRILQVTFVEPTTEKRFHIKVAINQPGGNGSYLKLLEVTAEPNEPFFVAGQPYKDGVLVLGISLRS